MLVPASHPGFVRSCLEYCWGFFTSSSTGGRTGSASVDKNLSFHTRLTLYALVLILSASWITSFLQAILQKTTLVGVVFISLFLEVSFFFYQRNRYQEANGAVEKPEHDPNAAQNIVNKLLSQDVPLDQFLSGWFHNTPIHKIKRDNVVDFLSYGLYYNRFEYLPRDIQQQILEILHFLEEKLQHRFVAGYDNTLQYMAHLWEPLRVLHMPLVVYLVTEFLAMIAGLYMLCWGFEQFKYQGMKYWVRAPRTQPLKQARSSGMCDSASSLESLLQKETTNSSPIVFLHGVLGLIGCIPLLKELLRTSKDRPMLVVDMPHVSLRLIRQAPTVDELASKVAGVMTGLGWTRAAFVGHSYGTFVISRVYQKYFKAVDSMVLLEPVAMLTCWPDLLQNFVYATPSFSDLLSIRGIKYCLRWYASRELTMAQTICRKFLWSQLILWPQDLPEHTLLVLSEHDDLVPCSLVVKMCTALNKGRIMVRPNGTHGDILLNFKWQNTVMTETAATLSQYPTKRF